MPLTSYAQVLADVKRRHPGSSSSAIAGTARKNWARIQQKAKTTKPKPTGTQVRTPIRPPTIVAPVTSYGQTLSSVQEYDAEEAAREGARGRAPDKFKTFSIPEAR